MEIVWTEVALDSFYKVVDYLFDYWSIDAIITFEENVDKLIEKITIIYVQKLNYLVIENVL